MRILKNRLNLDNLSILLQVVLWWVAIAMYLTSAGTQIHTVNHISAIPPPDSCFANENCLNPVTNEGYKQNDTCHPSQFNQTCHNCPQITCQFTRYEKEGGWFGSWMIWFNLFAFYWTMEFVTALGELVLAGVFSQWYWTHDKSKLPCCSLSARSSSSCLFTIPKSTNLRLYKCDVLEIVLLRI